MLVRGERVGARRAIMHKACTYGVNPNADARLAARVAAQSCPDFNSTQYPTQRLPLPYVVAGAIDGRNLFPIRPTFLVPQVPGFLFQSHDSPPPSLFLSLPWHHRAFRSHAIHRNHLHGRPKRRRLWLLC